MIRHSVLGREVRIEENAVVRDSVIFDKSTIGKKDRVINTIVEKRIAIPDNCVIGEDFEADEERDILITKEGIRVVHAKSKL
jgi:glucose-1-phosphate adenylyltransferase